MVIIFIPKFATNSAWYSVTSPPSHLATKKSTRHQPSRHQEDESPPAINDYKHLHLPRIKALSYDKQLTEHFLF